MMNGVFHSLRGEFDLGESYSGQAVLGVIVSTIKVSAYEIVEMYGDFWKFIQIKKCLWNSTKS